MPDNTIDSEVDELVEEMVSRFLGWKLPPDFRPDAGISFKPDYNEHTPHPAKHEPVGTNLFTATQAKAMIRYITDGLLEHKIAQEANKAVVAELKKMGESAADLEGKAINHYSKIHDRINALTADKEQADGQM